MFNIFRRLGAKGTSIGAVGLPSPSPQQPNQPSMEPLQQPQQPIPANPFVYRKPVFGMRRQMVGSPSMQWRLGN